MNNYAVINLSTGIVENMAFWDGITEWSPGEGYIAVETEVATIGWRYVNGEFIAPPAPEVPPLTPEEILSRQSAKLQGLNQLAAAQKTALTNRIGTLQDAVDNIGVEGMEEFAATPAEEAELPVRKAQFTKWKNYAILLGRVTSQTGWPPEVQWPVQPTSGMDLTVSSMVPETI